MHTIVSHLSAKHQVTTVVALEGKGVVFMAVRLEPAGWMD
jgi:hypothetical protein